MTRKPKRTGFTLLELVAVIGIISLLAVTALPSILGMFTSGTDAQAYNVVVAMLSAARAEAMQSGAYVCVHFEKAYSTSTFNPDKADTYWCAVLNYDPASRRFVPNPAHAPRRLPGTMAIGEVRVGDGNATLTQSGTNTAYTLSGIDDAALADPATNAAYQDFTTFSVIFGPGGNIVRQVEGANPRFANVISTASGNVDFSASRILFYEAVSAASQTDFNSAVVWGDVADTAGLQSEPGATALTLFDGKKMKDSPSRTTYLNENGQILAINLYTGQLLPRK